MNKYAPDIAVGNKISFEGERLTVFDVIKAGRLFVVQGTEGETLILGEDEYVRLLA